jgi:hypothetical protein
MRIRPEHLPARLRVVDTGSDHQTYPLVAGPIPLVPTVNHAAELFADDFK